MGDNEFFILRHGKPHGPCSLDELKAYIAYGSLRPDELVGAAGTDNWQPVSAVLAPPASELEAEPVNAWEKLRQWWQRRHSAEDAVLADLISQRRRAVRYRDWDKVPQGVRSGVVFWRVLTGFLFFPPRLWAACSTVFTQRIIRNKADGSGYLKTWPAGVEVICTLLIIVNALAWWLGLQWLAFKGLPVAQQAMAAFSVSFEEMMQTLMKSRSR